MGLGFLGLRFGVRGFRVWAWGLGVGVEGLGFEVYSLELKAECLGFKFFWVWGLGILGFTVEGLGFRFTV